MEGDTYQRLANHLSNLGIGYPVTEDLEEILRANFTPEEAEVALALPTRVAPLQPVTAEEIIGRVNLTREELVAVLERLLQRGLIFSGKTDEGAKGYALHQVGFGFPQTFSGRGKKHHTPRIWPG